MVTLFLYPVKEQDQGSSKQLFYLPTCGEKSGNSSQSFGILLSLEAQKPIKRTLASKTRVRVRHAELMQYASNSIMIEEQQDKELGFDVTTDQTCILAIVGASYPTL